MPKIFGFKFYLYLCAIFAFFFVLVGPVSAADQVYLHYFSNLTNGKVLDIYQKKADAGTNLDKWFRWRFFQYPNGNGAWDLQRNSSGYVVNQVLQTTKSDFTYTNGAGDGGTWVDYTNNNIVAKRRDSLAGYTPYSAYATYTASSDYSDVELGIHQNSSVNGIIRVKINDVASTSGLDLDSNGEYDEAAHGINNNDVVWIHIGESIHAGDVIKIEAKGDATNDRHVITGLRFYQKTNSATPGDNGWVFADSNRVMDNIEASAQFVAVRGNVPGQLDNYMFGIAHQHEYNASITVNMDSTPYTLDTNLTVNQVISGNSLTITETSTGFGNTKTTDDFGTLTRTMVFSGNSLAESWRLDFTSDYTVTRVYTSMWPANFSTRAPFRYVQFGDNFVVALTNDNVDFPITVGPNTTSGKMSYFGGSANLKVDLQTSTPLQEEWITNNGQKSYFYASTNTYYGNFHNGNSLSGSTTITLTYQTPEEVDWTGKTLYIAKNKTISSAEDFIPFNSKGTVAKVLAGSGIGLTFNNVYPSGTYFTSQDDDLIGLQELNSDHSPGKGDWTGVTVTGSGNPFSNIFNYATTGLTLSSNANAYNNSFYQDTTGINAASGSTAKNNVFSDVTTNTAGQGTFDYNNFTGNTETNGLTSDPLFTNVSSENFSLQSTSSLIDAGTTVAGVTVDYAGNPIYGTPDIGAYEYQPPYTIGTNNIDVSGGARIYANGKFRILQATSGATANLSITPTGGFATYNATTVRPQWLDVTSITWTDSNKQWTESSTDSTLTNTVHTVGGLTPGRYYQVKVDDTVGKNIQNSSSCSSGACQADSNGQIAFTYTGTYSTHTFDVTLQPTGGISVVVLQQMSNAYNQQTHPTQPTQPTPPTTIDQLKAKIAELTAQLQSLQQSQPSTTASFQKTLVFGSNNQEVKLLQDKLKELGFFPQTAPSNGNFGPATLKAVQQFQLKYNIVAPNIYGYGIVGPMTRKALNGL
jgi:hypothetical protein